MSGSTSSRGEAADLRVAEWIFRAAALLAALGAVALLAGSNGVDLLGGRTIFGYGADSSVLNERSELQGTAGLASVTRANAELGDLDQRSSEAAASGSRSSINLAEVSGPVEATVNFWGPSDLQRWAWVLVRAVPAGAVAGILWLFAGLARSARHGDPFTRANVRRLGAITVLTTVAGVVGELGGTFVRRWLLDSSDVGDLVPVDFSLSFAFAGVVLVMVLVTGVWRRGVAMRADLEGLV